ncbi:hypothetical protein [Priestia aryabhattai]|uniref:hypothetical protein n=1 Tax=Priestia aryabhattai TaxID=412384 RepID=UPI001FB46FCA|nr:hypothetical protein [Priestia aryabhattai]
MGYFLLGGLIIALIIPIFIACFMHFGVFSHALGDANGWLGFWGGYLGALVGAATVYILTRQQLKTQRELHTETIEGQTKLHEENLIHQRKLQMESIEISADMSDQRQRDLIVANLRIDKVDKLIQEIISLNGIISERFNVLRRYAEYNDLKNDLLRRVYNEQRRRRSVKIFQKLTRGKQIKVHIPYKKILISRSKFKKYLYNQTKLENRKKRINEYVEKIDRLLEEETLIRGKIRLINATIKSESIIANLEDELDKFRGTQTTNLETFRSIIANNQSLPIKDQMGKKDLLFMIDKQDERLMALSNQVLGICRERLEKELFLFTTKDGTFIGNSK